MVPGFVLLGAVAILFQVGVIAAFYGYLRSRHRPADTAERGRAEALFAGGIFLTALGQFAAIGAIGSLRVSPLLSFEQALLVQDAGLLLAGVGYVGVIAGAVLYPKSGA